MRGERLGPEARDRANPGSSNGDAPGAPAYGSRTFRRGRATDQNERVNVPDRPQSKTFVQKEWPTAPLYAPPPSVDTLAPASQPEIETTSPPSRDTHWTVTQC